MNKKTVIDIIASGIKVAKKTSENFKAKSVGYVRENILNNEFVTREEYQQLHQLVLKLSEELKTIKKMLDKKQ